MILEPVLHSLVRMMFLEVREVYPGQNCQPSSGGLEVFNGSILAHCQNFDEYDRAFTLINDQGLLSRIPFPEKARERWREREFVFYQLRLVAEILSEHLNVSGVAATTNEAELVGCFLSLSSLLSASNCRSELPPMPVGMKACLLPDCYADVGRALASGGYCVVSDRHIAWLPKISPIMEAEGIWANGKLSSDIRQEAVVMMWKTMPGTLKASTRNIYGQINPLSFYQHIRMHWHPELGWNEQEDYRYAAVPRWQVDYRDLTAACERGLQ